MEPNNNKNTPCPLCGKGQGYKTLKAKGTFGIEAMKGNTEKLFEPCGDKIDRYRRELVESMKIKNMIRCAIEKGIV